MCGSCSCSHCKPTATFAPYGYDDYCANPVWGCPAPYCQCTGTACGTPTGATAKTPGSDLSSNQVAGADLSSNRASAGNHGVPLEHLASDGSMQTQLPETASSSDSLAAATTSRWPTLSAATAIAVCAAVGVTFGLFFVRRRARLNADVQPKESTRSGLPSEVASAACTSEA